MLTSETYFSPENQMAYMGASQFKAFMACPAAALAEIRGEYRQEETTALLVGSFVDAYFEGTLDLFKAKHPELFKRDGCLKSEYIRAEQMIQRVERDPLFMKYMGGDKQVILSGEISGVPYKIKIDSYHPHKAIVDLKTVKDFSPIWDDKQHAKLNFADFWRYDIQGAIYQEIVRQNTGETLPFFLAAVTKENHPDLCVMSIPDEVLNVALEEVKENSPRFFAIKAGEELPSRCEHCDFCKDTKQLKKIIDYRDLNMED